MNRADLKRISLIRLRESKVLLDKRMYSGAYYLAGYSIECSLKACIAKKTKKGDFPDKKVVEASHTHNLENLVKSAGLEVSLNSEIKANINFSVNWTIVKDWSELSRYEFHNQRAAEDLFNAITDPTEGVLQWIKLHW